MELKPKVLGKAVAIVVEKSHPESACQEGPVGPVCTGHAKDLTNAYGNPQAVYLLGVPNPVTEYTGIVIAVIQRLGDLNPDDIWVLATENCYFTREEILKATHFAEQFYENELFLFDPPELDATENGEDLISHLRRLTPQIKQDDEDDHLITDEEQALEERVPGYLEKRKLFHTHHRLPPETFSFTEEAADLGSYPVFQALEAYPIPPYLREDYHIRELFQNCVEWASEDFYPIGGATPHLFSDTAYACNNNFLLSLSVTCPQEGVYCLSFQLSMNEPR